MKKILTISLTLLVLAGCKGEEQDDDTPVKEEKIEVEAPNDKKVEVLFDQVTFSDDMSLSLLRELGEGMCNEKEKDLENYIRPACNAKFFKFFPLKDSTSMKDAFALLIKARVHGFPIRRTLIYQREKGKLVKVNGFAANLIELRKAKSGTSDLVLRFSDKDQNHFNCLYVWRSNHYEYEKVEEINDSRVKKEFQDSMNLDIFKFLEKEGLQKL